ncbi:MAG: hypothetical protein ACI9X0_002598 [Kiritimatiellia bacterium]
MIRLLSMGALCYLLLGVVAHAQYADWRHSGSFYILTTQDGAALPASAREENFPVLLRLDREGFDFSQVAPGGDDIRFTNAEGLPLTYQIDAWDPTNGHASIWIRIPLIKGDAQQEIKMFWGNPEAATASSGSAVFSATNGFLSVFHMSGPVLDELGTVTATDTGTAPSVGMIGAARHFPGGKGIFCGDAINHFPTGAVSHSSQAWIRPARANGRVLGWGNEARVGKVIMQYKSPPHMIMECYFSGADVRGGTRLFNDQWVHVVHTYEQGNSRLYINGALDGVTETTSSPLDINRPARMWIGGWYNNYNYAGDIDEVRLSNVFRSADWITLEYENQKPQQRLVGPLVRHGNGLSVSEKAIRVDEGQPVRVRASVGDARKWYWIIKRGDHSQVIAVDRLNLAWDAGRVAGDLSLTLQLKAVYADGVKTVDIPVTIEEAVPEPVFNVKLPRRWDGRSTLEIEPRISNLKAMQAAGASALTYDWTVSGLATINHEEPGKLVLARSQNSGELQVSLTLSNGGPPVTQTASLRVAEPKKDAWVERVPEPNEKPEDNQFYARGPRNEGTLYCNGTIEQDADSLFLKLYADGKLIKTLKRKPCPKNTYAFAAKLKPGLIKYRIELGCTRDGVETVLHTAKNMVCGDAYIIEGQSNALATDTRDESPRVTNDWIRSYSRVRHYREGEAQNLWCNPVWKAKAEHRAELGWWGMELAKQLVESQQVPIFMVNAAAGGTRIDMHQCNPEERDDRRTIYGRMLWRVQQARLTHGIRAIMWHQGESDQGSDGPDGGYGWETYEKYFLAMSADWKRDFPNVAHYYLFQIWPNSCSMGNGHGNMLREVQRSLPRLYGNMDVMSTLGIKPGGGCHYPLTGWAEFTRLIFPLIERDIYNKAPIESIAAPNLLNASYVGAEQTAIVLTFDQPVIWHDGLINEFYLDGAKGHVASGRADGSQVTLLLKAPLSAERLTYLDERSWSQDRLLVGQNGIAALTFCDVVIDN